MLTLLVVLAAGVIRVALAARQSYWTDELFSVEQASHGVAHLLTVGRTEVHTPLYATLLWVWEGIGGTHVAWTRLLSVLLGFAAVLAAQLCLRRAEVSQQARLLAVALTAASGFGIVYAQEDRPYVLVLLGATGLTAVTLERLAALERGGSGSGRGWLVWFAWALLSATAHLLGAALVVVLATGLVALAWRAGRVRAAAPAMALGAVALLPQLAWIVTGLGRSGFAGGTAWIRAPRLDDVWLLLTTTFGVGGLTPRADGFAWTSPLGVVAVVGVLGAAGVAAVAPALRQRGPGRVTAGRAGAQAALRQRGPGRVSAARAGAEAGRDLRLGLFLLGVAGATLLGTFVLSQLVHVWTLRNMIVVVPALTWGAAWVAAALPRTPRGRRVVAAVLLVAASLSLIPIAGDLQRPYKTDFRALTLYLERERAAHPGTTLTVFGGDLSRLPLTADQSLDSPAAAALLRGPVNSDVYDPALDQLHRLHGRQIVVYYGGVGRPVLPGVEHEILRRLSDPACAPVPVYGLVVVSCP